jgi:hypothetical protein
VVAASAGELLREYFNVLYARCGFHGLTCAEHEAIGVRRTEVVLTT